MGSAGMIVFGVVALAGAVLAWRAISTRRSIAVALAALAFAAVAGLLAYYAQVESHSSGWALGYGVVAVLSAAVGGRHLTWRLPGFHGCPRIPWDVRRVIKGLHFGTRFPTRPDRPEKRSRRAIWNGLRNLPPLGARSARSIKATVWVQTRCPDA